MTPTVLTKAQFREVARRLRPDITDSQFNALWAKSIFERYQRRAQQSNQG